MQTGSGPTSVNTTAGDYTSGTYTLHVSVENSGGSVNNPPIASCNPNPATVYLDANGIALITTADIDNGSSDPDGDPISLSLSNYSFDCSNVGPNNVTLTVSDEELSDTCTAVVTVSDNTSSGITCPGKYHAR